MAICTVCHKKRWPEVTFGELAYVGFQGGTFAFHHSLCLTSHFCAPRLKIDP
jgi:hypothetical protein